MARASLEDKLAEFPCRVEGFEEVLREIVSAVKAASDGEAAGAEVEDACSRRAPTDTSMFIPPTIFFADSSTPPAGKPSWIP
jgi:hypothetical protein